MIVNNIINEARIRRRSIKEHANNSMGPVDGLVIETVWRLLNKGNQISEYYAGGESDDLNFDGSLNEDQSYYS